MPIDRVSSSATPLNSFRPTETPSEPQQTESFGPEIDTILAAFDEAINESLAGDPTKLDALIDQIKQLLGQGTGDASGYNEQGDSPVAGVGGEASGQVQGASGRRTSGATLQQTQQTGPGAQVPISGNTTPGEVRSNSGRTFPTSPDGTPIFRQGDPEWGRRALGSGSSISAAGCAMASTAMAISRISGRTITPGELDQYLDRNRGYSGNGLNWDVAARAAGLGVRREQFNLNTLNAQIDAGRPVVLGVDYKNGSRGGANGTDHWITITGRTRDAQGNSVYLANDPASGRSIRLREQNGRLVSEERQRTGRPYTSTSEMRVFTGGPSNPAPMGRPGSGRQPTSSGTQPTQETNTTRQPATSRAAGNNDLSGFRSNQYDSIINEMSQRYNVPARLIKAVIQQESGFNPNARSSAGARGLMQLMPGTAREMGVTNPNDPRQSIEGGTKYLARQLRMFNGDIRLALAAYNAGPGNVMRYRGVPPFRETQGYVRNITASYYRQ